MKERQMISRRQRIIEESKRCFWCGHQYDVDEDLPTNAKALFERQEHDETCQHSPVAKLLDHAKKEIRQVVELLEKYEIHLKDTTPLVAGVVRMITEIREGKHPQNP